LSFDAEANVEVMQAVLTSVQAESVEPEPEQCWKRALTVPAPASVPIWSAATRRSKTEASTA
jgi:hypothetical protein